MHPDHTHRGLGTIFSEFFPIIPALRRSPYYSQNYAGILGSSLIGSETLTFAGIQGHNHLTDVYSGALLIRTLWHKDTVLKRMLVTAQSSVLGLET